MTVAPAVATANDHWRRASYRSPRSCATCRRRDRAALFAACAVDKGEVGGWRWGVSDPAFGAFGSFRAPRAGWRDVEIGTPAMTRRSGFQVRVHLGFRSVAANQIVLVEHHLGEQATAGHPTISDRRRRPLFSCSTSLPTTSARTISRWPRRMATMVRGPYIGASILPCRRPERFADGEIPVLHVPTAPARIVTRTGVHGGASRLCGAR